MNGETSSLEIPRKENIEELMYQCILNFQTQWRDKPTHLVLCPEAFLQWECLCREKCRYPTGDGDRYEFTGVPIVCADIPARMAAGIPRKYVAAAEWKTKNKGR